MTRFSRSLVGASLFSAAGALPVLFLPALLAAHLADGATAVTTVAATGAVLLVGELTVSLVAPMVLPVVAGRGSFLPAALGFLAMILWSAFASGPAYLLAWFGVGGFAAFLQYLGTTRCLVEANPAAASQLRLSVSLFVSGCCLLIVAGLKGGSPAEATLLLAAVCGVLMFGALVIIGSGGPPDRSSNCPPHPTVSRPITVPFLAVATFFGIFVTFVSLLPSLARHGDAHTFVAYMAVGKLVAAPALWLIARHEGRLRRRSRYEIALSGILAAASVAVIYLPSIVLLIVIEVALNATAGIILGRFSETLSPGQTRWAFSAIQIGGAVSFALAHVLAVETAATGFLALVVLAAFLPVVPWSLVARPSETLRRVAAPQD